MPDATPSRSAVAAASSKREAAGQAERRVRHLAQQLGVSGVVEREALEHECEQAETALRAVQSELRQAEARLAEVKLAAEEEKKRRESIHPDVIRKAEAAQVRKLEAQIETVTEDLRERREKLRALMTDKQAAVAAAVENGVDTYFNEQYRRREALRERRNEAKSSSDDTLRATRIEQEDLKRSIAQLTRRLKSQEAEATQAVQERDAMKILLTRRESSGVALTRAVH
eukprot:scaffold21223_cov31-Tisochrysis_lutea.AAC.4